MRITGQAVDSAVLTEVGRRLAALRLEKNLSQSDLAEQAGVSKSTVQRIESGDVSPQLSGFIRVCRALGIIERFDLLVPEPTPSPVELLKLRGKHRRRASKSRTLAPSGEKWRWGDEK